MEENPAQNPVEALIERADTLAQMDDNSGAESILQESLEMAKYYDPDDHITLFGILMRLGRIYESTNDEASAETTYSQAIQQAELLNAELKIAEATDRLAQIKHYWRKDLDGARPLYARVVTILKKSAPTTAWLYRVYSDLAFLISEEQRNPEEGVELLKDCLTLAKAVYGESSAEVSDTIIELGEFYVAAKNYDEAERCFRRAIEMDKDRSSRIIKFFKATDHLSNLLAEIGEYPEAEILRKRSIAICESTPVENVKRQWANLGICYFSYASLLTKMGRESEAEENQRIGEGYIEKVRKE